MPRPQKPRRVCCLPERAHFGPLGAGGEAVEVVTVGVDEYEAIRLIDLEGFTQEECAQQMAIARTTVQQIYNEARKKLSAVLVEGKPLVISGGDYQLCDGNETYCGCGGCRRHRCGRANSEKGENQL